MTYAWWKADTYLYAELTSTSTMRATYVVTFLAVLGYVQAIALSKLQRRANNRNKKHRRDPSWPSVGGDVGKGCLTVFVQQPASAPFQAVQPNPHPTRTVLNQAQCSHYNVWRRFHDFRKLLHQCFSTDRRCFCWQS